jgi:hypothetical protein
MTICPGFRTSLFEPSSSVAEEEDSIYNLFEQAQALAQR